ncbi:TonB-dependent receptor [Sphingosinicella sp. BN140058]|uniref:TonB-dependent receptor n=1 Tax=Sphingosinicella sp. BN140058 TaxID=1892855 RepID=UPI001FB06466|nr:TonB-dependent receptor [Sphingosinicella sp. BN140058]
MLRFVANPRTGVRAVGLSLLASTMLLTGGAALAEEAQDVPAGGDPSGTADQGSSDGRIGDEDEIIVTAQKREENLQDVPIAITALGTAKLEQLQVNDFQDYARNIPSISVQSGGPGFNNVYFRGVASGENANHSGPLPSVGTYLDEQPITTTTGALDIHVFDIARVEALAGPQGTLYGASSQAGTVRIITNKPDTSGFYGEANAEVNTVAHGEQGYIGEAFINAPISDRAAVRVVGWYRKDAGYIDNIPGTLTFPSSGISFDNDALVEDDYNDVETYGARAALKIELDDEWTILPQVMAQKQVSHGFFAQERGLDELQVQQFNPERNEDKWYQAALTVTGKIGNFDLTYAGAYMQRQIDGQSDYVDYAYFYDALAGYGTYFYDNDGNLVNPNQYIQSDDSFTKQSHELRFSSPADKPVRLIAGLFYQRQEHNIEQNYIIDNIADSITVPGTESDIWLTKQIRVDRDYAAFGEVTADMTSKLSFTLGTRIYRYRNSLKGFFGYSSGYSSKTGVAACFAPASVSGSPCTNLDNTTSDTDFIHRLNVTYKVTDDALVYATVSRGFRPGGINRRTGPGFGPYQADFIDNYEAGFKTSWWNNRIRFNAAIYQLNWSDIQLSFLGANGLTVIRNAGDARIRGAELDFFVRPATGFTISAGAAYNDAQSKNDFCRYANSQSDCTIPGPGGEDNEILAPEGTRLPLTSRFKANALARYEFPVGANRGHFQINVVHEGRRTSDLRLVERAIQGDLDEYTTVDLSTGIKAGRWNAELYVKNLFDVNGALGNSIQCAEGICGDPEGLTAIGPKVYTYVTRPRTIGLRVGTRF